MLVPKPMQKSKLLGGMRWLWVEWSVPRPWRLRRGFLLSWYYCMAIEVSMQALPLRQRRMWGGLSVWDLTLLLVQNMARPWCFSSQKALHGDVLTRQRHSIRMVPRELRKCLTRRIHIEWKVLYQWLGLPSQRQDGAMYWNQQDSVRWLGNQQPIQLHSNRPWQEVPNNLRGRWSCK